MKRRWFLLSAFLGFFFCGHAVAQTGRNLVANPSFEDHTLCPEKVEANGVMKGVVGWWQPTAGSSDYFHACGKRECTVPRNKLGMQVPRTGNAYCGIYCSQEHYREYLQTELTEPLQRGGRYRVTFYVSLADKSPHAVATLGALMTPMRVGDSISGVLANREETRFGDDASLSISTPLLPQVVNDRSRVLDQMEEWMEVSGEFVAEGGERFLTIGNFNDFNKSSVTEMDNDQAVLMGAYYFVDDVSVECVSMPALADEAEEAAPPAMVSLNNIYFEVGKSDLLPASYSELQRLAELMQARPTMRIEVHGHTDNQGSAEFNQALSEARAKAVADYLVGQGISPTRLMWKGYGAAVPVDSNDTPEGRQRNRRVEYSVVAE